MTCGSGFGSPAPRRRRPTGSGSRPSRRPIRSRSRSWPGSSNRAEQETPEGPQHARQTQAPPGIIRIAAGPKRPVAVEATHMECDPRFSLPRSGRYSNSVSMGDLENAPTGWAGRAQQHPLPELSSLAPSHPWRWRPCESIGPDPGRHSCRSPLNQLSRCPPCCVLRSDRRMARRFLISRSGELT